MAKIALWILIALTALRYWACTQAPISSFEAYLLMCAHRLDAAFFDGPAGPAYLVHLGSKLFTDDLLALRWSAPLFSILATVSAYFFGKELHGTVAGLAAALLINVLPGFQIDSIQSGNALPALAFWILGMLFVWHALLKRVLWSWWIAGGIAWGLGLEFSYWVLLGPFSCILYMGASHRHRSASSLFGLGALLLLCIVALIGPVEWNARQQWIPFTGWTWQTAFKFEEWTGPLLKLLGQISLPGAVLILLSFLLCLQSTPLSRKARFLTAFATPPLMVTVFLLIRGEQGPILLSAAPLFIWLGGWWQNAPQRPSLGIAVICGLAAFCSALTLAASPSFSEKALQQAAATVEEIARLQAASLPPNSGEIFLIAETPRIVSEFDRTLERASHGGKHRREIFLRESPDLSNQFRLWPSYCDFTGSTGSNDPFFTEQKGVNRYLGRSALYITFAQGPLPQTIAAAFQEIIPLQTLQILREGRILQQLNVYLCRNYQTLPL